MENRYNNKTLPVEVVCVLTGMAAQSIRYLMQIGEMPGRCVRLSDNAKRFKYIITKKDVEEYFGMSISDEEVERLKSDLANKRKKRHK